MSPPQSPVNQKPCGTFPWPTGKSPFTPFLPSRVSLASPATWQKGAPQSCIIPPKNPAWLLHLDLNLSARLPLQPHFRLLPKSVLPASIPVFFQLYWAALVSPGRCGPMVWSQPTLSSHAGTVTGGSCFPVTSWVEVTPIPLPQSMATAI